MNALSAMDIRQYDAIQAPSIQDFFQKNLEGKVDIGQTEGCLQCLKVNLNQFFENSQSKEFRDALILLSKQATAQKDPVE